MQNYPACKDVSCITRRKPVYSLCEQPKQPFFHCLDCVMHEAKLRSSIFSKFLLVFVTEQAGLTLCPPPPPPPPPLGFFFCFLSSADFFQNQFLKKINLGIPSQCLTDWTQIRPDILSGLILVQTVCKGYQKTSLGAHTISALV